MGHSCINWKPVHVLQASPRAVQAFPTPNLCCRLRSRAACRRLRLTADRLGWPHHIGNYKCRLFHRLRGVDNIVPSYHSSAHG